MRKFTALLTSLLLLGIVFPTFSQVKVSGFNDDAAIKAADSDLKKGITLSKQVNMSEELQPSSIQIKKGKAERLPIITVKDIYEYLKEQGTYDIGEILRLNE